MRNVLRLSIGAAALMAVGACSRGSDKPTVSEDLRRDLARVGAGDVELAGGSNGRIDVVSAAERVNGAVPAARGVAVARAPSANRGTRAAVPSARRATPAAAAPRPREEVTAPVEAPRAEPAPEPVPATQGRPRAPQPSTQREPAGGWKTMEQIRRTLPFPITPLRTRGH